MIQGLNQRWLAIDWDARRVRMVQARSKGDSIEVLRAASAAIPSSVDVRDAEALGRFIGQSLREAGFRAKSAMINIPREHVVLNTLELPPTPEDELATLVQFQIVKELPFSAEQATIEFAVCGTFNPKEPCRVLVAAVRNSELAHYEQVLKAAGLSAERIGLRPYSNLVAVAAKNQRIRESDVLLVEVGPRMTEIDIVSKGVLKFSRAADVVLPSGDEVTAEPGPQVAASAEEAGERRQQAAVAELMREIIHSYEAQRATESKSRIDHVVVSGGSGLEPHLIQALAARFAVRAEAYDPKQAFDLQAGQAEELRGFSAVLGLLLSQSIRQAALRFDFKHPKRPVGAEVKRRKKATLAAATVMLVIGAGYQFHSKLVQPVQAQVKQLESEVAPLTQEQKKIKDFEYKLNALKSWQEHEQLWPEVLIALSDVFPSDQEAYVTRMSFETKPPVKKTEKPVSHVAFKLRMNSNDVVNRAVVPSLEEIGFENIKPGRTTEMGSFESYRHESSVSAELHTPLRAAVEEESERTMEADAGVEAGEMTEVEKTAPASGDTADTPPNPTAPAGKAAEPRDEETKSIPDAAASDKTDDAPPAVEPPTQAPGASSKRPAQRRPVRPARKPIGIERKPPAENPDERDGDSEAGSGGGVLEASGPAETEGGQTP